MFWSDRIFEGVAFSLRLSQQRIQFYSLEGTIVTRWHEKALTPGEQVRWWGAINALKFDDLRPVYAAPKQKPGEPPIEREIDQLVAQLRRGDRPTIVQIQDRHAAPQELVKLIGDLEDFAQKQGGAPTRLKGAWLAVLLEHGRRKN